MPTSDLCCICGTQKTADELVFTWSRASGHASRCHGCARRRPSASKRSVSRRGPSGADKKVAKTNSVRQQAAGKKKAAIAKAGKKKAAVAKAGKKKPAVVKAGKKKPAVAKAGVKKAAKKKTTRR